MSLVNKLFLLTALTGFMVLTACKKSKKQQKEIEKSIQEGNWKVTKYVDSGEDETYHFNGYTFTFDGSGTITATNGSFSNSGTWSIQTDDSNDDLDFNIFFSNISNNFDELNDDWDILSNSKTTIELIDRDDDGNHDYLTFEKN
mgnify:CR=1 FL=1